jgi:hypothetical protein
MANRALAAKVERARKQAGALAQVEFAKPFYQRQVHADRKELNQLVQAFNGKVTYCQAGKYVSDNRKRAGCDPRTRSEYKPGRAVRCGSALSYGWAR